MLKTSRAVLSFRFALIMVLLLIYSFPIYWMLVTSLQPVGGYVEDRTPHLIPKIVSLESYKFMLQRPGFLRQFYNSVVVSVTTTIVSTIIATLAGYGFSRFSFTGKTFLRTGVLIFQMFPKVLLIVPYFLMMRYMGLLSTHLGLILAYTSFTQPFCIWMLVGFFDAIPKDLDECAMVDGASRFQAFSRVIIPLAAPGVAATALFAFVLAWHEYLFSLVLAVKPESALLPQGLVSMIQEWDTLYEPMMAGAIMVIIPVIVVYVLLERHFVSGLTAGAVKG
jgi:ABC-type glycerol-3-phosphate transport system permease component